MRQCGFEVMTEACRVKERAYGAGVGEARAQVGEELGPASERESLGGVVLERVGDELGEPQSFQQAGGDAGRVAVPAQREHRQSRPERIAGGGVSVVREGVEEEIRLPMASQMLGQSRGALCEA